MPSFYYFFFFFFNDSATTEIYTLSLHDALPISYRHCGRGYEIQGVAGRRYSGSQFWTALPQHLSPHLSRDRKSTRLNSSHTVISYAVFCLKKKKKKKKKKKHETNRNQKE